MMKIGILGGSFNPAHEGHVHISQLAIKKFSLQQLWWIPTSHHPFKKYNNYLSLDDRIKICQELTSKNHKIKIKKINNFYTIDLVKNLQKQYRFAKFMWIMGADNLPNFHKWHKFHELINIIEFQIFARSDCLLKNNNCPAIKLAKKFKKNAHKLPKINLLNSSKIDISSTKIRLQNA